MNEKPKTFEITIEGISLMASEMVLKSGIKIRMREALGEDDIAVDQMGLSTDTENLLARLAQLCEFNGQKKSFDEIKKLRSRDLKAIMEAFTSFLLSLELQESPAPGSGESLPALSLSMVSNG